MSRRKLAAVVAAVVGSSTAATTVVLTQSVGNGCPPGVGTVKGAYCLSHDEICKIQAEYNANYTRYVIGSKIWLGETCP